MRPTLRLIGFLVLAACPTPLTATPDDGGILDVGRVAVSPPAAPIPPEPTVLTPCPSGWQEVSSGPAAPVHCQPWPSGEISTCAEDQARFPGDPACRLVGTACTDDDWATGITAGSPVHYVKAGAPLGGTGTRASPYSTVAAAMAVARSGDVIAVGKGAYEEEISLVPGVTLWGACVAQTVLAGTANGRAVVIPAGLGGTVKNLRLTGPTPGVLANPSGRGLTLVDVILDGTSGSALLVGNTATVDGHDVVIRNTQFLGGRGGRGMSVEYGGQVSLSRVVLENNGENAISLAEAGSKVSLTDAVISKTRPRVDGTMGRAASVQRQAELRLSTSVIEQNHEVSLGVAGATVVLTDVLVRDTRPQQGTNEAGTGLTIENDSKAQLRRCTFANNRSIGITVRAASQLEAQHLLILDTALEVSSGADGIGLNVIENSRLVLEHAYVARNHTGSIGLSSSSGLLKDVDVVDSLSAQGNGLQVNKGAQAEVARMRVFNTQHLGSLVDGAGSGLIGSDFEISASGNGGLGLQNGATVALTRAAFSQNRAVAVQANGPGTTLLLTDVLMKDTKSEVDTGSYGRGLHTQGDSQVVLTRVAIENSLDVGLFVGQGVSLQATDLRIADTEKAECVTAGSCASVGGSAVSVIGLNATFSATSFELIHSAQCGLQLAKEGTATASDGMVSGHLIGACIQTPSFDVQRISDRVTYVNNTSNLDAPFIPLPNVTRPQYNAAR